MTEKIDLNFLKNVQRGVEPNIIPGETALEALQRIEKEKAGKVVAVEAAKETIMASLQRMENERLEKLKNRNSVDAGAPPARPHNIISQPASAQPTTEPPAKEIIFYEGYKLPRDFFTCLALCIIKLNNPEINEILKSFGFEMKDLNGKLIVFEKKKKRKK